LQHFRALREAFDEHQRTSVERLVARDVDEATGKGRPLSDRARQYARAVDIDGGIARERRLLERAYEELRAACRRDGGDIAERWRSLAESWPFPAELIELIDQHNEWYPIERDLPLNPRTGDYVRVGGRSYRRPELGPAWVLEQLPAEH